MVDGKWVELTEFDFIDENCIEETDEQKVLEFDKEYDCDYEYREE